MVFIALFQAKVELCPWYKLSSHEVMRKNGNPFCTPQQIPVQNEPNLNQPCAKLLKNINCWSIFPALSKWTNWKTTFPLLFKAQVKKQEPSLQRMWYSVGVCGAQFPACLLSISSHPWVDTQASRSRVLNGRQSEYLYLFDLPLSIVNILLGTCMVGCITYNFFIDLYEFVNKKCAHFLGTIHMMSWIMSNILPQKKTWYQLEIPALVV